MPDLSAPALSGAALGRRGRRAAILHKHALFRDLIAHELCDLAPAEIAIDTTDPEDALACVATQQLDTLIVESGDGAVPREAVLDLFRRAAGAAPGVIVIAANLATSEVEVLQDTITRSTHLASVRALVREVAG
jgi:DNA-binding NarL/FixJ family response regulator